MTRVGSRHERIGYESCGVNEIVVLFLQCYNKWTKSPGFEIFQSQMYTCKVLVIIMQNDDFKIICKYESLPLSDKEPATQMSCSIRRRKYIASRIKKCWAIKEKSPPTMSARNSQSGNSQCREWFCRQHIDPHLSSKKD